MTQVLTLLLLIRRYIGSIPYAEYGVLSLTWLGYDAKQLDRELTGGRRTVKQHCRTNLERATPQ